ncbi:MAG: hypothetical protein JSW49_03930 [candidate division WOR-3 bacterium]|nr:MAG: hypothetical protein JSW49_03930 [candidate division WOR-3 bacterium]
MMKKLPVSAILVLFALQIAQANKTRMSTLMTGDFIDDIFYTDRYPHRLLNYQNSLFLDIDTANADYGIFVTPNIRYGVLGLWQNSATEHGFNIGYAINLYKFDIGTSFSPVKDNMRFALSIGRDIFNQHVDISFLTFDGEIEKMHSIRARYAVRLKDFIVTPRYAFDYVIEPADFQNHRFGVMVQRVILNEGFVYVGAEYDMARGDIENDSTHIHAGVELKLNRSLVLRCGAVEHFINGFEDPHWQVEPGIGLRIRDFSIDFHLNKDRLFDKEQTFVKSFGLDFFFGRF